VVLNRVVFGGVARDTSGAGNPAAFHNRTYPERLDGSYFGGGDGTL